MIQKRLDDSGTDWFYDVGVSVGAGGYNYQEDTMLVQYFIKWIAVGDHVSVGARADIGVAALAIDGIVGPETLTAILKYQQVAPLAPGIAANKLITDGRVDPSEATIVALNNDFFTFYPNLDPGAPGTWFPPPPLLAAALARVAGSSAAAS
jgi:hypothetical protein